MTESDDQGRYVFEGVPPGEVEVCRMVNNMYTGQLLVQVAAGQTTTCQFGFNGRVIKGHLTASDSYPVENWKHQLWLTFSTESSAPQVVRDVPMLGSDWQVLGGTDAARAKHDFAALIEPNGDFQIEDVPPGAYQFRAELREGGASPFPTGKLLGQLAREVVMPVTRGGESTQPLDLGNLVVQMNLNLKQGDAAPDFTVKTVDGATLRLLDYRGKYVLLDFWATWCGPCVRALPHMRYIAKKFDGQPFVMLSISQDRDEAEWMHFVGKNGMTWLQARDAGANGGISRKFGVTAVPSTFSIDADGVLEDQHVGDAEIEGKLKKLVARAVDMANRQPQPAADKSDNAPGGRN